LTGGAVGYSNRDGNLGEDVMVEIWKAQKEREEEKQGKLTLCPEEQKIVNKYIAMANADKENDPELRFLKRHAAISGIVTSDIIPDNRQRAERVDQLSKGSVPLQEIESAYDIAKVALRKASRMNSYIARVSYGSNSNNAPAEVEENGLTNLEKQLKLLQWEI
jgi:hypothetical protein